MQRSWNCYTYHGESLGKLYWTLSSEFTISRYSSFLSLSSLDSWMVIEWPRSMNSYLSNAIYRFNRWQFNNRPADLKHWKHRAARYLWFQSKNVRMRISLFREKHSLVYKFKKGENGLMCNEFWPEIFDLWIYFLILCIDGETAKVCTSVTLFNYFMSTTILYFEKRPSRHRGLTFLPIILHTENNGAACL